MDSTPPEQHAENSTPPLAPPSTSAPTPMESSTSLKRSHITDSDSDNSAQKPLPRHPRMAPKANITGIRNKACPPTGNK